MLNYWTDPKGWTRKTTPDFRNFLQWEPGFVHTLLPGVVLSGKWKILLVLMVEGRKDGYLWEEKPE